MPNIQIENGNYSNLKNAYKNTKIINVGNNKLASATNLVNYLPNNGKSTKFINAVEIDWNGILWPEELPSGYEIPGVINSTGDLVNAIKYAASTGNSQKIEIMDAEDYEQLENPEEDVLYFLLGEETEEEPIIDPEDYNNIVTNLTIITNGDIANAQIYTNGGTITLIPGNTYTISGSLRGNILIDATTQDIQDLVNNTDNDPTTELVYTNIKLNGVKILSETNCGIEYRIPTNGKGYKGMSITVEKNTFNYIICTQELEVQENQPGAIYSMNNLEMQGAGYLAIKNNGGHGIRGQETTLTNLHLYCDAIHDGIHGKNIKIIGGTYYFDYCNDCFGTSNSGSILFFDGQIRKNTIEGKILDSKNLGLYFDESLLTQEQLSDCFNMQLVNPQSFANYVGLSSHIGKIFKYASKEDFNKDQNAQELNLSLESVTLAEGTFDVYHIDEPYISVTGYLDHPLYFDDDSIFNSNQNANVKLNNAYIGFDQNLYSIYYYPSNKKGSVRVKANNDTLNVIKNSFYDSSIESIYFHADAIKSENNIAIEVNNGSTLYINSKSSDGVDGGDVKFTDSKGNLVIANCGERGVKGNAIVIGPDPTITDSIIDTNQYDNTKKFEGICYIKNNCKVSGESNAIQDDKTVGFADIFARNGKAKKGMFGTTNEGLDGFLITGSIGAIVKADLGNATNLFYNSTYYSTSNAQQLNIVNDPGISTETYFAKTILNTNIEY